MPDMDDHSPEEALGKGRRAFFLRLLMIVCSLQFLALAYFVHKKRAPEPAVNPVQLITPVAQPPPTSPQEVYFKGHPGPWGELEFFRINIVSPDDFLPADPSRFPPTRWNFSGMTPEQLATFIQSCDLTPAQKSTLLNQAAWSFTNNLIVLTPGAKLVLEMSNQARTRIYEVLADSPDNDFQTWPFTYRLNGFDDWFENSNVSPATLKLVKGLVYERGQALCFSDLPEVLAQIPSPTERRFFARTLMVRGGLLMKLRIRPDSDIGALTEYWSRGGRAKDVSALLESLTHVPGSAAIDVAHLLPSFARTRLNTFPRPPASPGPEPDCFWTAMNFFKSTPAPYYENDAIWRKDLAENYSLVPSPTLGDVVFLLRPDGVPYHAAVYIADDVVFTKNGGNYRQAWLLMKMSDMLARYPTTFTPQIAFFRQKEPAN